MENNRKTITGIVTYLAECGVSVGTTGVCSTIGYATFGKTRLGRAFVFVTSVCAGVCTALGFRGMLQDGAEYTVNALADAVDELKDAIEIRKEPDIHEVTKEDEAN